MPFSVEVLLGSNAPFGVLLALSYWFLKMAHEYRNERLEAARKSTAQYAQDPDVPADFKGRAWEAYRFGTQELNRRVRAADFALLVQILLYALAFVVLVYAAQAPALNLEVGLTLLLLFTALMIIPATFIIRTERSVEEVEVDYWRV